MSEIQFSKESVQDAAKQSGMSVNDYLDKLPPSYYEDAARQSGINTSQYLDKLKGVWGEPVKKKDATNSSVVSKSGTSNISPSTSQLKSSVPSDDNAAPIPPAFQYPSLSQMQSGAVANDNTSLANNAHLKDVAEKTDAVKQKVAKISQQLKTAKQKAVAPQVDIPHDYNVATESPYDVVPAGFSNEDYLNMDAPTAIQLAYATGEMKNVAITDKDKYVDANNSTPINSTEWERQVREKKISQQLETAKLLANPNISVDVKAGLLPEDNSYMSDAKNTPLGRKDPLSFLPDDQLFNSTPEQLQPILEKTGKLNDISSQLGKESDASLTDKYLREKNTYGITAAEMSSRLDKQRQLLEHKYGANVQEATPEMMNDPDVQNFSEYATKAKAVIKQAKAIIQKPIYEKLLGQQQDVSSTQQGVDVMNQTPGLSQASNTEYALSKMQDFGIGIGHLLMGGARLAQDALTVNEGKINYLDQWANKFDEWSDKRKEALPIPSNLQRSFRDNFYTIKDGNTKYHVYTDKNGNIQSIRDNKDYIISDDATNEEIGQKFDALKTSNLLPEKTTDYSIRAGGNSLVDGINYMAPVIAGGLLTGGSSIPVQLASEGTIFAAQTYDSAYKQAKDLGIDNDHAKQFADKVSFMNGALVTMLPVNSAVGAVAKSPGLLLDYLMSRTSGKMFTDEAVNAFIKGKIPFSKLAAPWIKQTALHVLGGTATLSVGMPLIDRIAETTTNHDLGQNVFDTSDPVVSKDKVINDLFLNIGLSIFGAKGTWDKVNHDLMGKSYQQIFTDKDGFEEQIQKRIDEGSLTEEQAKEAQTKFDNISTKLDVLKDEVPKKKVGQLAMLIEQKDELKAKRQVLGGDEILTAKIDNSIAGINQKIQDLLKPQMDAQADGTFKPEIEIPVVEPEKTEEQKDIPVIPQVNPDELAPAQMNTEQVDAELNEVLDIPAPEQNVIPENTEAPQQTEQPQNTVEWTGDEVKPQNTETTDNTIPPVAEENNQEQQLPDNTAIQPEPTNVQEPEVQQVQEPLSDAVNNVDNTTNATDEEAAPDDANTEDAPEWTPIRQAELSGAKNTFEKRRIPVTVTMQNALHGLAKEAKPDETLYDVAKRKMQGWYDTIASGTAVNLTTEENAQALFFRTMTQDQMASSYSIFERAGDGQEQMLELANYDALANNLSLVDSVLGSTNSEAGRAFQYLQTEGRFDKDGNLNLRRMEIVKAQNGEPLTPEQEDAVDKLVDEEKRIFEEQQKSEDVAQKDRMEQSIKDAYDKGFKAGNKSGERSEQRRKEKVEKVKAKIADDVHDVAQAFGFVKAAYGEEGIGKVKSLVKMGKHLLELGEVTIENVFEKIKEHLIKEYGDKVDIDSYKDDVISALSAHSKYNALSELHDAAKEQKATAITPEMVKDGLITDLIDSHIHEGTPVENIYDEAFKNVKEALPETTERQFRDAYLKEGDFKQPTKEDLHRQVKDVKAAIRNTAKLKNDIEDLENEKKLRESSGDKNKRNKTDQEKDLAKQKKDLIDKKNQIIKDQREAEQKQKVHDWRIAQLEAELERLEKRLPKPEPEPRNKRERSPQEKELEAKIKDQREQIADEKRTHSKWKRAWEAEGKMIDKLNDINQQIKDVEERGQVRARNEKLSPKQIDKRLAEANAKLKDAVNKKGIKIDKNSKEAREAKIKLAEAHNDRVTAVNDSIDQMLGRNLSDEDRNSLEKIKLLLDRAKINTRTIQDLDQLTRQAHDKIQTLYDNVKKEAKNSDSLAHHELKEQLRDFTRQFNKDKAKMEDDLRLSRYEKAQESQRKIAERKIAGGDFEPPKVTLEPKRTARTIELEMANRRVQYQFKKLQHEAEMKGKSRTEKILDFVQRTRVASLIINIMGLPKIALSLGTKVPLETITRNTTGLVSRTFASSLAHGAGSEGGGLKAEYHRYRNIFGSFSQARLDKMKEKSDAKMKDAGKVYRDALDEFRKIPEGSPEANKFALTTLRRAQTKLNSALIDFNATMLYEWQGASTAEDSANILLNGYTKLKELLGSSGQEEFSEMDLKDKYYWLIDSFGRIHQLIKNPSGRGEFAAGFITRLQHAQERGVDISDPKNVIPILAKAADKDFKSGTYQQETNFVTNKIRESISNIKRDKDNKFPFLSKAAGAILDWEIPILKTPMNIISEALTEYTGGLVFGLLRHGFEAAKGYNISREDGESILGALKGIDDHIKNMDEDTKDAILRMYRKGGMGALLIGLSMAGVIKFGGFYRREDPKKKPGELDTEILEIGGKKLPKWLSRSIIHLPFTSTNLLYLNWQRVAAIEQNRSLHPKSWSEAQKAAFMADWDAMEELMPYNNALHPWNNTFALPIPGIGIARDIGTIRDMDSEGNPVKRQTKTFMDHVYKQIGMPGKVPLVEEKKKKGSMEPPKEKSSDEIIKENIKKKIELEKWKKERPGFDKPKWLP